MSAVWQQQAVDELRQRLAALFARRGELADVDALQRVDGDIEVLCRDLANAERALRTTP
jgi:hypothetical protein